MATGFRDRLVNLGFSHDALPSRLFPSTYSKWSIMEKASFLQGCYSANGCVIKDKRIGYKTTNSDFAKQLQMTLLLDFGISSYITTNKSKTVVFKSGPCVCKESYDINIGKYADIQRFSIHIGFYQQYKRMQLQNLIVKKAPYVRSIEKGGIQKVYDFSEPLRHWGVVENCIVHNCGEEPLPANGACLLGSINLAKFVKDSKFDMDEFNYTVHVAVEALNEGDLAALGADMSASHASLRDFYEVTGEELDTLALAAEQFEELTIPEGSNLPLARTKMLGSRMTGAGFGGCTVSIVHKDSIDEFISQVGVRYTDATGLKADFYVAETDDGAREVF